MNGDPLHTRLCEEYGCEVPIVAFAHTRDVIVSVCNAGGIGILGGAGLTQDELRANIRWIRERVGGKPSGSICSSRPRSSRARWRIWSR